MEGASVHDLSYESASLFDSLRLRGEMDHLITFFEQQSISATIRLRPISGLRVDIACLSRGQDLVG